MITQTGILNADVPVLNWVTSYVLELTTLTRSNSSSYRRVSANNYTTLWKRKGW